MQPLLLTILVLATIAVFVMLLPLPKSKPKSSIESFSNGSSCSLSGSTTCDAIADVNNPAYNVKEVIMNDLLIEQHLAEKDKYCKACIVKHFLISRAYLQEALQMAGNHPEKYPRLESSLQFHQDLFDKWHANMDDDKVRLETLDKLREWRRQMIDLYYF
jgi:hypothetical protein